MVWNRKAVFVGSAIATFFVTVSAENWNSSAKKATTHSNTKIGTVSSPPSHSRNDRNGSPSNGPYFYQLLLRNAIAGNSKAPIPLVFPANYDAAEYSCSTCIIDNKETGAPGKKPPLCAIKSGNNLTDRLRAACGADSATETGPALDLRGDLLLRGHNWGNGEDARVNLGDCNHYIRAIWGDGVRIGTYGVGDAIVVKQESGNVGIGTENPGSCKLAVEGVIGAREVVVTLSEWSDFVFNDGYELPTLDQVADYIKRNKRLRGIPGGKEIASSGVPIGEMQAKLLQKIEELTLYVIELNQENKRLRCDLHDLENRMAK